MYVPICRIIRSAQSEYRAIQGWEMTQASVYACERRIAVGRDTGVDGKQTPVSRSGSHSRQRLQSAIIIDDRPPCLVLLAHPGGRVA